MGRRTNNADILNAKVVSFDPGRGPTNLSPYTQTTLPTSLTATSTIMNLVGPGVVNLLQFYDAVGTPVRVRVNLDGTDMLSASTGGAAGVYCFIGSAYSSVLSLENVPFRDNFTVYVSKPTGVATSVILGTAYRLVEL